MILGAVGVSATFCRACSLCQWISYEQRDCIGVVVVYQIAFVCSKDPHAEAACQYQRFHFLFHTPVRS
jgi:hypothetical protein